MKAAFVFVIVLGSLFSYSQDEMKIDTLFVSKCQDLSWASQYRNGDKFTYIKFEDGAVITTWTLNKALET